MNATGRLARLAAVTAYVAVVAGLAACATQTKPLAPDAAAQLHKIALLHVQEPPQYGVANLYLEGVFLGGVVNIQHGQDFTKVLLDKGFNLSSGFARCLVNSLTAAGFDVEQIEATRKPIQMSVISHASTNADAILNVALGAGYVSVHGVDDYTPTVGVVAELLENRSGHEDKIYVERFRYGYTPLTSGIRIAALPTYSYGSFDKLMQANVEAGQGLQKGADLICERLAQEIAASKH